MKLFVSNMASAIKGIVSKNKIRYKEDGFDLDLSYISKNIIAMGFPAETLERFYRNHIDDVVKFLDAKHKDRYKVYNLCSERKRKYDTSKFHGPVVEEYSFQDHNPPPFDILKPFCESVHKWITSNSNNVAAIHCKAGKGRTGVMICAYLVHAGFCELESGVNMSIDGADFALEYYGRHRTHDSKGVTIPSQKRYVYYYEDLVKRNLEYRTIRLRLSSLILTSLPVYNGGAFTLICEIYHIPKQKIKSFDIEVKKGAKNLMFNLPEELFLQGDIKFEFYIKKIKKEKLFQFCINTFFVGYGTDTYTVATDLCPNCNGDRVTVLKSKHLQSNSANLLNNQSVIDLSFLKLSRNESSQCSCDCMTSNPADFIFDSTAQSCISNSDVLDVNQSKNINRPNINSSVDSTVFSSSQPSSLASTMICDNKMSTSSSSTSSSSSTQSLCRKISGSDLHSRPSQSNNSRDLYLVLPKDKLDKAYKDKSNKIFVSNFKVILKFNTTESESNSCSKAKNHNRCYQNCSSDTENYSDDDDETSDMEINVNSNLSDQKSTCTSSSSDSVLNTKKGETTYL